MIRILLRKYVGESALLWSACALALVAFNILRVWLVSLVEMDRFRTIIEQFREYERFSPIPFDQMFTYEGRIGMTFDEPIVVLCIVVWVVARGSDVISGELGRGTLEMLLAQPVTRFRILLAHGIVATSGLAALTICVWLGIWIGIMSFSVKETPPPASMYIPVIGITIPLGQEAPEPVFVPMRQLVDAGIFGVGCLNLFAFGFALLGISSLASSWDRYRWRVVGFVIGFYVVNLIVMITSQATEKMKWLEHFTYFSCYKPGKIIQTYVTQGQGSPWAILVTDETGSVSAGPLALTLIMITIGFTTYIIAAWNFNRRDLPAPV